MHFAFFADALAPLGHETDKAGSSQVRGCLTSRQLCEKQKTLGGIHSGHREREKPIKRVGSIPNVRARRILSESAGRVFVPVMSSGRFEWIHK